MVDASVGGKTGVDFGILKNQIGTFYDPQGRNR
jgi:3-dehydroquinate synthase